MRVLLLVSILGCAAAEGDPRPAVTKASPGGPQGPLVLELFTSQGCSSCPPADRYVSSLTTADQGRPIAPLAFHVDYWNGLGWEDPYSLPAWTERQRRYSDALGDNRVYTPELVVGGARGMVGSHRDAIARAIREAPPVEVLDASATWSADRVEVTARAPADADVFVAVWETTTSTKVPRGENAGETLVSDRVVRRFERVARAGQVGTLAIPLDSRWRAVGAVAFAQRSDMKIVASTALAKL